MSSKLAEVLLAFAKAPGNYPMRLREPQQLHAELETLAAWALGRVPAALAPRQAALRDAAVLFVQRACFAPHNTHYQVLGLAAETMTAASLRTRYRALIRLTHPDMGAVGLPADAAGIVNRAHSVLSNPAQRARYDEKLAKAEAAPPPRPSASPRQVAPHIEQRPAWQERWQSLMARYPNLTHRGLLLGGIGLAVMGLLVWVTTSTQDARTLIVARSTDGVGPAGATPSAVPVAMGGAHAQGLTPVATAASTPGAKPVYPHEAPSRLGNLLPSFARDSLTKENAVQEAAPQAEVTLRLDPSARLGVAALGEGTASQESKASAVTARVVPSMAVASAAPAPLATPAATPSALIEPVAVQAAAAAPIPQGSIASASSPTLAPSGATLPAAGSATLARMSQAALLRPPGAVPATVAGPGTAAWGVDTSAAKTYLAEVLSALERPAEAKRTNAYLMSMKVKGSLLRPALLQISRYTDVNIDQMSWTDNQRGGVMNVQGAVVLTSKASEGDEPRRVSYRLIAEFAGTRDGTFMTRLDLREAD